MSEWIKEIPSVVSAIAAAVAVFFSYKTIIENRKNVFLLDKNRVALAVNRIARGFESESGSFKISEYSDEQATIVASKYHFDSDLYEQFMDVLVRLHRLEKSSGEWADKDNQAQEIAPIIKKIECDIRLD
ncbi:hypothetical protein A11A3_12373 [Alcanivorax hongdengensis A-11-3]|uniref:Uncharacterized protein n=1 Tax=Alcanivorax hongdengensis A-11-3 TaxID=1177179 RepID=L0W9T3_9GAMM|nr:hypothetical protein [Alcanivorax hongdengensis]EKF73759.1 hypothetical protein A11A3_12373 [Alcanivorax hongdengensis A-11-3]